MDAQHAFNLSVALFCSLLFLGSDWKGIGWLMVALFAGINLFLALIKF